MKGKKLIGFSDTQKEAVELTKGVSFLLEDEKNNLPFIIAKETIEAHTLSMMDYQFLNKIRHCPKQLHSYF